jgi:hypothetical protein
MDNLKQQDTDTGDNGKRQDEAAPDVDVDVDTDGADALNDARALQQMIEGTPDSLDEFRRIEQKR